MRTPEKISLPAGRQGRNRAVAERYLKLIHSKLNRNSKFHLPSTRLPRRPRGLPSSQGGQTQ